MESQMGTKTSAAKMNGMSMVSRIKDFLRTRVINSRLMMIYILDIYL